jgi:hypothetical protein
VSAKKRITETLLAPVIAAGASLAARYAVKKGPELVENTLLPWLRQATDGAGGVVEKVPDLARSAVSSGGDLAEKLTDRARDVTGGGGSESGGSSRSQRLSREQLSERSEDRAKRREQRRKATKGR